MSTITRRRKPAAAALAAFAAASLLVACSSEQSPTATTTTTPAGPPTGKVTLVTHDSFELTDEQKADLLGLGLDVEVTPLGDGGTLVNQLILTKDAPLGDVAYGIDNIFGARALDAGVFTEHASPALPDAAKSLLLDGSTEDGDPRLLLQIFSQTMIGPVFFEFIQRKKDEGFGEGNFTALFKSIEQDQLQRGVLKADESAE